MARTSSEHAVSEVTQITKASLKPEQCKIIEIIEALGFGLIGRLLVKDGLPSFKPEPRITQEVRFGRDHEHTFHSRAGDTLRQEFAELLAQMNKVSEGFIDIEVRHSLPFR